MGLGTGTFHTFGTVGATVPLEGWVTSTGMVSAAVANGTATATTVNFTLEGINTSGCNFTVYAYLADTGSNAAVSPVTTYPNQCITNKTLTLNGVAIPAYAVRITTYARYTVKRAASPWAWMITHFGAGRGKISPET